MRPIARPIPGLVLAALLLAAGGVWAEEFGGFDLSDLAVDRERVVAGGPERDQIKSVDTPEFADLGEAAWIGRDTEVLGLLVEGEPRAYPVRVLEYHQVVNDVVAGVPVAVTYDPLAGTPIAYKRVIDGKTLHFGVSGLLYNHNFLLYDRETESLWSQFLGRAVAGPLAGKQLERLALRQETGGVWSARHLDSVYLRPPFPEKVPYRMSPYSAYWIQDDTIFPVAAKDETYHQKELVLGVEVDGKTRAYLGSILTRDGGESDEKLGGKRVRVRYDTGTGTFQWEVDEGVRVTEAYWLAWKAFHPDTEIWHGGDVEDAESS